MKVARNQRRNQPRNQARNQPRSEPASTPRRPAPPAGGSRASRRPLRGRTRILLDSPHVTRFREFLDTTPGRITLASTAVVAAVLGPLAIYAGFALAYLFRRPLRRAVARVPLGPRATLGVLILLAGLSRHLLAWVTGYVQDSGEGGLLLHPQLVPGLLISLGIYVAWALGWGLALIWYRYRLVEVLLIQGLFGIVIENLGQFLAAGLAAFPVGILLWLYAAAVSASTLGLAWVLAGDKLAALPPKESDSPFRFTAPPLLIGVSLVAVFTIWGRLLDAMGAIPDEPAPIRERPFW